MKKVLTLVAILFFSKFTFAQEKLDKLFAETTPDERARYQTERMKEELSLRQDQQEKVFAINLKYTKKMEEVYNQGGGKLQRLRQMKTVGQEKDAALKTVLDTSQYKKYEQMRDELRESVKDRVRGNRR